MVTKRMMFQAALFTPPTLTVTDLTRYLRQLLESDSFLQDVWLVGEVSNLKYHTSGHVYLTLKDDSASLKAVVWKTHAMRLRFRLSDGMRIEAHGSIGVYEVAGQYQLYIDTARPAGEGQLYQEFLRLKARLEAEGLFDEERKRPLPLRPACIGIITSPTGAALQDMLNTLRGRYPLAHVLIAPSSVQGAEAPGQIVGAFKALARHDPKPDVILLGRGGGSLEDLWAFNDERVVRAVAGSPIPVVTGVGHETDFTLADFAADLRAPTPTAAAVLATPDPADLRGELRELTNGLTAAASSHVQARRYALQELRHRLRSVSPLWQIRNDRQRLDELAARSQRSAAHTLEADRLHLQGLNARLGALNPLAVLERGYALVSYPDGSLIHRAASVNSGESVSIRMSDGRLSAEVTEKTLLEDRK
jgi:exodeoxyribonuclease VII large subunit